MSRKHIFIAFVVSIGGFLFGFDASVVSGVIKFIVPQFNLTDVQLGWVVSSPSFASMFAMLLAGSLSDLMGRKRILLGVAFLYALSALLSAFATSYLMLVIARMIGGAAFGAALVLAPVYIAEVSPAKSRGKLVSIQQLNIVLGFSAAYFCNYFLLKQVGVSQFINETNAWRWMLGIELVPAILYFFLLFMVPKSPRWLFTQKRDAEANEVLKSIYGAAEAKKESEVILNNLGQCETKSSLRFKDLLKPALLYVMTIGIIIGVLQQITGVNAIYFYATTIFEQSGVGSNAAFAQAIWIGIINVVFTLVAMFLIDKAGRKPLMLFGVAGVAISMCVAGYGFSQATYKLTEANISAFSEDIEPSKLTSVLNKTYHSDVVFKNDIKQALGSKIYAKHEGDILKSAINMNSILVLLAILGFVASFAISLGPVMWVLLSELFPNWVRGMAISVVGFINSLVSWGVQFVFPIELANLGSAATFYIFGAFAVIGFLLLLKLLPETKGKSLEQIENDLVKNI
ncbi:sugar porter family MFS transporter [Tamlana sp. I1]|uniref:sugar porter family MFS transporter n=1 Tax=Tamlana sp. I1 TaxID=2762061 RepID=UPI00188FA4E6|nr:sugar porter family MFS transporter [Tamlana sp. I1]